MDSPAGDLMTSTPTHNYAPYSSLYHSNLLSPRGGDHGGEDPTAAAAAAGAYRRRLESYRQAQHQQALLVARLQSKV